MSISQNAESINEEIHQNKQIVLYICCLLYCDFMFFHIQGVECDGVLFLYRRPGCAFGLADV